MKETWINPVCAGRKWKTRNMIFNFPCPQELRGWWPWRWRSRAACPLWSRRCWRICRTWRRTRRNTRRRVQRSKTQAHTPPHTHRLLTAHELLGLLTPKTIEEQWLPSSLAEETLTLYTTGAVQRGSSVLPQFVVGELSVQTRWWKSSFLLRRGKKRMMQ